METTLNKIAKSYETNKNKRLIVSPDVFEALFGKELDKEDLAPMGMIDGENGAIKVYADWSLNDNEFKWEDNTTLFTAFSLGI